jgi:tRNA (cmo5U34)-methyltransferase
VIDLSRPMLDRASDRIRAKRSCAITAVQADIREVVLADGQFDVVVAAAVLHHLRTDDEWRSVFAKIYNSLRPGGAFFVSDLVSHSNAAVHSVMWQRYGEYLTNLKGADYKQQVFSYIEFEDTPTSVTFQLDTMREAGFTQLDILHKSSCFAAFVGVKQT